jgi:hypothetical protein
MGGSGLCAGGEVAECEKARTEDPSISRHDSKLRDGRLFEAMIENRQNGSVDDGHKRFTVLGKK